MIEFVGSFRRGRVSLVSNFLAALLAFWSASTFSGLAQTFMPSTVDASPVRSSQRGVIIVAVTYDQDGKVQRCQVVRSNAPLGLESSTLDYIRKHWGGRFFAGGTEVVPLLFDDAPTTPYWSGDMATPPNFFPDDNHLHEITLRVTFGEDGWVTACSVILPSGIDLADKEIMAWVKVHWHSAAYAGKAVDAPFVFQQPKDNAPVSPTAPKNVREVPIENPQPEKAIPAVRVQ